MKHVRLGRSDGATDAGVACARDGDVCRVAELLVRHGNAGWDDTHMPNLIIRAGVRLQRAAAAWGHGSVEAGAGSLT